MRVKRLILTATVLCVAALNLGCGGGGTGSIAGIVFQLVRVEYPNNDPLNIQVGQNVTFVLAGYELGTNVRYVIPATSWVLIPDPDTPGTISGNGVFSAGTPGTARIFATWDGLPLAQALKITVRPTGLARVQGQVRAFANNAPTPGVRVKLYTAGNVEVGQATVLSNGTFTALVPTTAARINLDVDSLGGWLRQWQYRTLVYQAGSAIPNCHANIVASPWPPQGGVTSVMGDPIRLYDSGSPPPFPSGCQ